MNAKSLLRPCGFILIIVAGVFSIVATSTLQNTLYILTASDPEGFDSFGEAFACQGESLTLRWYGEGQNARLTAEPAASVTPPLSNKPVALEGELSVTLNDAAEFILSTQNTPPALVSLNLIPSAVCQGFAFNLIGGYEGSLEQSEPSPANLARSLKLKWNQDGLQAELSSNDGANLLRLSCTSSIETQGLTCQNNNEQTSLNLNGTISTEGYLGTYNGVDESLNVKTEFSGTFSFKPVARGNQE